MPSATPTIDKLRELTGRRWDHLREAAEKAAKCREQIQTIVSDGLIPADTALVVYGSLARNERTQGSDCDWTLLVDGQANGDHHGSAATIEKAIAKAGIAEPGPTGVFGSLAFSHELVHQIGGDEDTNRNTTRRVLLLLESASITDSGRLVRDRVVRQIVKRYLEQEPDLQSPDGKRRYPRFLLNDIVRYWRMIAVDYARKVRDRQSSGWALRNIKLRLSRKLTFVSGMLACFECVLRPREGEPSAALFGDVKTRRLSVQEQLLENIDSTPLETLASAVLLYGKSEEQQVRLAIKLLDPYDNFIALLDDEAKRKTLKDLKPDKDDDPVFQEGRKLGHQFQDGLLELFFRTDDSLTSTTQEYGVF